MEYLRKFTLSILLIFSISLLAEGVEKLKVPIKFSSPIQQVHPTIKKGKPLDKNISQKRDTFSSGVITSSSGVIERTFYFDNNMLSFEKERDYDIISIPNATYLTDIGYPSLPKISVKLLIPPGATATRVEVVSSEKITIPGEFNIFPAQPPVKISSKEEISSFVEPDPEIYNSTNPYPSDLLSDRLHNGTKCGYRITDFFIYPLQYIPLEKTLILYTRIKVRIYYEGGISPIKSITQHQKEIFGSSVRGMVTNPENIEIWAPPIVRNKGPYGDWEMVIIAPNNSAWIDSLQILADWKTKKGVPCTVKNLQDIYNAYSGSTDQWKIKQYINDMKTDSGTIWVLFGADHGTNATNSIPSRGVYVYIDASHNYTNLPCERYYEDLDNDWNYDGDSYYGENTDGPGGNQLNWLSDVYVGRMFADNAQAAGKYVRRILKYEKDPAAGYTTKALFYSDYLFGSNNGYYTTDECNDEVPSAWFKGGNGSHPGWHYAQSINNYQSDHATIDSMNSGYGFICTASHGLYSRVMDQGSDNTITISSTDIDNWLSPGDKLGIHTGLCCLSGGFDQPSDCIAEHIYDKGGIGGAWNSREGWGYSTGNYDLFTHHLSNGIVWQFFVQTFSENKYHLGEAVAEDKDHFVGHISDAYWNWCLKEYNTFGDPELPMWTAANGPDILFVTHDPTVPSGTSNFTINVKDNDNVTNIQGARVCCWCKSETSMYKKDTTNSSGNATLSINPTIVGDTMWVTVTKQNYKPYEGYAVVTGNAKPTTPTIIRIFDNAIFNAHPSYECTLSFVSTDPDNNDIQYQIQWSPDPTLSSPSSKNTGTFSSGDTVTTTILLGSTPAEAETLFYWKVRATDPGGSGNWSNWSDTRSLTMDMEVSKVYWYQVMGEQFEQGTGSSITVQGDSVILNQGPSGSDTLFYWVNAGQLYYLPQPDNYDDSLFTLSFTPAHAGTLKSASFYFYYLVGSGNIRIHVWDDASGWPGTELGYVDVSLSAITPNAWTEIDLSSLNISVDPSSDFYVGYSMLSLDDTLGLVYDTVGTAPEKCYDMYNGAWEKSSTWIHSNMTWWIETIIDYSSEITEGTLISPAIVYTDLTTENPDRTSWIGVKWTKSAADDSIGIQVEYKNAGSWDLVPEGQLPGNLTGFFDQTSAFCNPIDLGGLDETTYDTLRIKAIFRRASAKASSDPVLKMWALGDTSSNVTFVSPTDKPLVFALYRNNPNPFSGRTEIRYQLPKKAKINLEVFDIIGRSVVTLVAKEQKAGFYTIPWRGTDRDNKKLPSGIYFLKMTTGEFKDVRKMVILR